MLFIIVMFSTFSVIQKHKINLCDTRNSSTLMHFLPLPQKFVQNFLGLDLVISFCLPRPSLFLLLNVYDHIIVNVYKNKTFLD